MYVPPHFAETRLEEMHALMRAHPLGILVMSGTDGLDANHIPFELDPAKGPHGTLHGHVARANSVCDSVNDGAEVLVIFRGDEAYISPNWYPSKHETHRQVPTWNYRVVHAHGRLAIRDDEKYLRGLVGRLTRTHEAGEPVPWKMANAPRDYMDQMMKAIVGIEIEVTRLVGKSKLSQNKEARDRRGAAAALHEKGELSLAQSMLEAPPDL